MTDDYKKVERVLEFEAGINEVLENLFEDGLVPLRAYQALEERALRLVEALKFYGNRVNWTREGRANATIFKAYDYDEIKIYTADDVLNVSGAAARQALKEWEEREE